ncbi:MAG: zinc ribbon domain-containing protein [Chloroflexi bacterium]|nr:zinc ribbon domain-containing protein [Chloroflexota bacterium]
MPSFDLGGLVTVLQLVGAFLGVYLIAVWIGLVVWTFRDIRSRSRDLLMQILCVALVVFFFIPGILLYFLMRPREALDERYERELAEEALLQDIEEKQACPACQTKTQSDFLFCPNCHTRLKRRCENCHRIASLRWNICPYCGAPNTEPAPLSSPVEVPK